MNKILKHRSLLILIMAIIFNILFICACSSSAKHGPDKTIAGTVLGAAWGAGAGAVVGNQLEFDPVGEGAAVGAGIGAISGALQGAGYDVTESETLRNIETLDSLKMQNAINARQIACLQEKLDAASSPDQIITPTLLHTVFFEVDSTSLRSGSIKSLEKLAEKLKINLSFRTLEIFGHTDDSGNEKYNNKLAQERAKTVAEYLSAKGIPMNKIIIESFGATKPITNNNTETGKQFNRRVEIFLGN